MKTVIKSVNDLKVYQMAYQLAMEIFEITKKFPKEETYSLTDQMRRSSRSVVINIRDGYDEVNAMLYRLMKNWQNYSDI